MAKLLQPKVEATGIVDLLGMSAAKTFGELFLAPYVGNGTIKSGIVKLVGGGFLHGKAGRFGDIISGGLLVDAGEDIIKNILGMTGEGAGQAQNEWA